MEDINLEDIIFIPTLEYDSTNSCNCSYSYIEDQEFDLNNINTNLKYVCEICEKLKKICRKCEKLKKILRWKEKKLKLKPIPRKPVVQYECRSNFAKSRLREGGKFI
jgi:hypothetical protein